MSTAYHGDTARDVTVAALADLAGDQFTVEPYARGVSAPTRPLAMVRMDSITRDSNVTSGHRIYHGAVIVLASRTDPTGPTHDQLDAAVEDVLAALDRSDQIIWREAKSGIYAETIPCWEITFDTHLTITV